MLEVTNLPSKPVLAIHAGSVRRQAKLEVNRPFVIPHPGSQTGPVKVSLLQQLATHVLPHDTTPEVFCNIPVKTLDGRSSEVQLRIRRGEAANAGKQQKTDGNMEVTRDYLEHHQLQQKIQSLIQDVLREQPENPYKYMLQLLKLQKSGVAVQESAPTAAAPSAAREDAQPLAPRPPEQPKPSGTRPIASQQETKPMAAKPPEIPKPDVGRGGRPVIKTPAKPNEADVEGGLLEDSPTIMRQPQGEFQIAARFCVTNLLRMPKCKKSAEQSLRTSARMSAAKSIAGLVLTSIKEKITAEACKVAPIVGSRSLARASLALAMESAAVMLSPENHRALSKWTRYVAYNGGAEILGYKKLSEQEEEARRSSMPQPIVFLGEGNSSWGSWLCTGPSPTKSPTSA